MKDLATLFTPHPPVLLENEPQENICLLQEAVEDTAVLCAQLLSSDVKWQGGISLHAPFSCCHALHSTSRELPGEGTPSTSH